MSDLLKGLTVILTIICGCRRYRKTVSK